MADNQKAKHADSQSGQKSDQEKLNDQKRQRREEGNQDSSFAQGGEGDQKQEQPGAKRQED